MLVKGDTGILQTTLSNTLSWRMWSNLNSNPFEVERWCSNWDETPMGLANGQHWFTYVLGAWNRRQIITWTTDVPAHWPLTIYIIITKKYPSSPLKQRSLALIEQYLPNISDPVYSVHQSFMWFPWLNWRKSTFYPVTAPNDSKCWPIVTSSIQEPIASNCDVTMTDCSRVVAMDAFLAQWCWGHLI